MKFKLILDTRQTDKVSGEYPVKLRISDSKDCLYHTRFYLSEKEWDARSQTAKGVNAGRINTALSNLVAKAKNIHYTNTKLTARQLRDILKTGGKPESLIEFISEFIEECKRDAKRTAQTLKTYNGSLSKLKEFDSSLTFNAVGVEFYTAYKKHLQGLGNSPGTIGKEFKFIKSIMNEAVDRGMTENVEHKRKFFKVDRSEPETVYLTSEEINQIYASTQPVPYLIVMRDRFVLNCLTGLRVSDFKRITKDCIVSIGGKQFIKLTQQKTGDEVVIPLSSQAKQILEGYDFQMPPISDQKANEYIKEVIIHAKINKAGITNHTARRSFATNAFLAGVPVLMLMKVTGHRTVKSFMRYIRSDAMEAAISVADHSFFR